MIIQILNDYCVDCSQYQEKIETPKEKRKDATLNQRILRIGTTALEAFGILWTSFMEAIWTTAAFSGKSFRHIVLGYVEGNQEVRLPTNLPLIVFSIGTWVLGLGLSVVMMTGRKVAEKIYEPGPYLKHFIGDELDIRHIRCDDIQLDTSGVPETVQVADLVRMLKEVNFSDATVPGYMKLPKENGKEFTFEALQKNLEEKFVKRILKREPFLGTPPWYDIQRLMAFYQQMEDALRISIHKVESDLAACIAENSEYFETKEGKSFFIRKDTDPKSKETKAYKAYVDCLEVRARLVIDLAIAGDYCGARYMSETMEAHSRLMGDEVSLQETLEGSTVALLASARKNIAIQQIQKMGNGAHDFSAYMQNMGELLAIPGTKNIIEHLFSGFDLDRHVKDFFDLYTVDFILDTISKEFQTSQKYRERVTDWLKDQVNNWRKEEYETLAKEKFEIVKTSLKAVKRQEGPLYESFRDFIGLIEEMRKCHFDELKNLVEPKVTSEDKKDESEDSRTLQEERTDDFVEDERADKTDKKDTSETERKLKERHDNFIDDFFGNEKVRGMLNEKWKGKSSIEIAMAKNTMKTHCKDPKLANFLWIVNCLSEGKPLKIEQFETIIFQIEKKVAIKKIISIDDEVLDRALDSEDALLKRIRDCVELERQTDFLEALQLIKEVEGEGSGNIKMELSPAILEWITVSQKIFLPQQA